MLGIVLLLLTTVVFIWHLFDRMDEGADGVVLDLTDSFLF